MSAYKSVRKMLVGDETATEGSGYPEKVVIHGYEARDVDRRALEEFYEELLGYGVDASEANKGNPKREVRNQEGLGDETEYEVRAVYPEPLPPFMGDLDDTSAVEVLEAKADNRLDSLTGPVESPDYDVKAIIATNYPEVEVVDDHVVYPRYSIDRPEIAEVIDRLPESFRLEMEESEWRIDPRLVEIAAENDIPYFEVEESDEWRLQRDV